VRRVKSPYPHRRADLRTLALPAHLGGSVRPSSDRTVNRLGVFLQLNSSRTAGESNIVTFKKV
jgi:hypothetical protein